MPSHLATTEQCQLAGGPVWDDAHSPEVRFAGRRIASDPRPNVKHATRRLAAPTPPSHSGSVRRRLRDDAGPACSRWLRSRLIPGLRPRGSPGRGTGPPGVPRRGSPGGSHGGVVPATAPEDPVRGLGRPRRVGRGRRPVIPRFVPILTPLPDIPQHIIQAPSVRPLLTNRVGLLARIARRTRHDRPACSRHRRRETRSCSPPGRHTPIRPPSEGDSRFRRQW